MIPETLEDKIKLANLRHVRNLFGGKNLPPDEGFAIDFPHHPTLLDIAQRETEILQWHRQRARCARVDKIMIAAGAPGAIAGLLAFAAFLGSPWLWAAIPAFVLFLGCTLMFFIGLGEFAEHGHTYPGAECPTPLELVPFSEGENRHLIARQEPEVFLAACACPGCGDVGVHFMRQPGPEAPRWAGVVRQCQTCNREWAQR